MSGARRTRLCDLALQSRQPPALTELLSDSANAYCFFYTDGEEIQEYTLLLIRLDI